MKQKRDLKTIFFDIYNDKQFGQHTTNVSLQKRLERFRNQLSVDFYNLEREDEQIREFADKYMLYRQYQPG